jgi:hypothetical protein
MCRGGDQIPLELFVVENIYELHSILNVLLVFEC